MVVYGSFIVEPTTARLSIRSIKMSRIKRTSLIFFLIFFQSCWHLTHSMEIMQLCDFENDNCSWIDPNHNTWFLANSTSKVDPGYDHTCSEADEGASCGQWMSTVPPKKFKDTETFVLINTPVTLEAGKPYCFTFWYHFMGLEHATFEVDINTKGDIFTAQRMWIKVSPQGNNWLPGYVDIPPQVGGSVYLMFKATLSSKYEDTVGIDDLELVPFACPRTPDCDFETDTCGWKNEHFKYMNGTTPITDHTTGWGYGHYLLASGSSEIAKLIGPLNKIALIGKSSSYCLKGWYQFIYDKEAENKDQISYFDLNSTSHSYLNQRISIESVYSDGLVNQWVSFMWSFYINDGVWNETISLTALTHYDTQIAFDDFLIKEGHCEANGGCDFADDLCGWSNHGREIFIRNNGMGNNVFKGAPLLDATTKSKRGWYLMLPTELQMTYDAELRSPPLSKDLTCFSFSYYAQTESNEEPVLLVEIYDLVKKKKLSKAYVNSTQSLGWVTFYLQTQEKPAKYIIRIAVTGGAQHLKTDLAIDGIILSSLKCSNDHFLTPTSTALPSIEKRWDCNFNSCKGWIFDDNWTMTSFRKTKDKNRAPRIDHTSKSPNSNYLLWTPQINPNSDFNTTLSTLKMATNMTYQDPTKTHCLSFWYYDSSEIPFELAVRVLNSRYQNIVFKATRSGIAQNWKQLKLTFYSFFTPAFVRIELKTADSVNGSFAIDDISIRPSKCDHLDGFTYSFDQIDDLEVEYLKPLGSEVGFTVEARNSGHSGAPNTDFTTGSGTGTYFLFVNKKSDFNTTYQTRLVIPDLPAMDRGRDRYCVRFAYQLSGKAVLKIYYSQVDNNFMYSPSFIGLVAHTNWVMGHFSFRASYKHKIVFDMTKLYDSDSYIALDDITIVNRNCYTSMDCDFDDDICSFYYSYNVTQQYEFSRMISPPRDLNFPGPTFDHTKRGYGGGFLYMTGFPATDDRYRASILRSPIQSLINYNTQCLSFWSQITGIDADIKIVVSLYSEDQSYNTETIFQLTNLTEDRWTFHSSEVPSELFRGFDEFDFRIVASTRKAKTVIAIDDIELDSYSCKYDTLFACDNGPKISIQKVNDFVKDCTDGSDEDSYDCDFEKGGKSYWVNNDLDDVDDFWQTNYATWKITQASTAKENFPKLDGSGQVDGNYLSFLTAKSNQTYARRRLVRDVRNYQEMFKRAFQTCKLSLSYYINDPNQEELSIRVLVGPELGSEFVRRIFFSTSATWQNATVPIGAYTGAFSVAIEGDSFGPGGLMALDNIKFIDCGLPAAMSDCQNGQILCATTKVCIALEDLCDFQDDCGDNWDEGFSVCKKEIYDTTKVVPNCDFELSQDFCGFSNDTPTGSFYFQDVHGNRYSMNQPSADHTTGDIEGQYVSLKTYLKKYLGQTSKLYTPMMTAQNGDCVMHFFYNNMNHRGNNFNTLRVFVRYANGGKSDSGSVFTNEQPTYNWIKGKVSWSSSHPFQFVFEGKVNTLASSISIDDVSFSSKCIASDAKRTSGGKSAAVPIILVILALILVGVFFYFLYRHHKEGRLAMPSFTFRSGETASAGLVNPVE